MKQTQDIWVELMAHNLVCEVTEHMSGILLSKSSVSHRELREKRMAGVRAWIGGDVLFQVQFFAERRLFYRMTENILGDNPSEEDVEDCAMEYFNVLCGRFISELINQSHVIVKLMPIHYEQRSEHLSPEQYEAMHFVNFISDTQEHASFSWTAKPIQEMMMRSN